MNNLRNIDIYLFDQMAKGAYEGCSTVLDAGCGGGRNLLYFLKSGFEVFAVDSNETAIARVRKLASSFSIVNPEKSWHFLIAQVNSADTQLAR